jgi:hypothetical protein
MSEDTLPINAAQLAANRANSQRSTGPRSLVGKLRSSQNALKHGRYAGKRDSYLRSLHDRMRELGEDPEEFAAIEDGLRYSFVSANASQEMLVHDIALLHWQRRRLERAQAALGARRIQQLEIERERESLQVSQKISSAIPSAQVRQGLIWDRQDSPTKFQRLLEWLEVLRFHVDSKDFAGAGSIVDWIYGPVPTVRGAIIKQLFRSLAEAGAKRAPDESNVSALRLELLRETANIQAQYQLYLREHVDLTAGMREERLAPTAAQRPLIAQMSLLDRQIDQKIRLLLAVQRAAAGRDAGNDAEPRRRDEETMPGGKKRKRTPKNTL